jgi:hypothetical protein
VGQTRNDFTSGDPLSMIQREVAVGQGRPIGAATQRWAGTVFNRGDEISVTADGRNALGPE